jgi:hypothetical protein
LSREFKGKSIDLAFLEKALGHGSAVWQNLLRCCLQFYQEITGCTRAEDTLPLATKSIAPQEFICLALFFY